LTRSPLPVAAAALLALLLLPARPAVPCDGTPPELHNTDDVDHPYELQCGRKTEQTSIPASSRQSLEGRSACKLLLGTNPPTTLHPEMVCTITSGQLTCDLL
jgi:hypothetical protein